MNSQKSRLRNALLLSAIAGTLVVAPALIFSPQVAQAQQGKFIDARGVGQLQCPTFEGEPGTSPPLPASISLTAEKNKGTVIGDGNIYGSDIAYKNFRITGGSISGKYFSLKGVEQTDSMCFSYQPVTVTISGECGINVPIQFRAANGQTGEFEGTVACAK